MGEPVVVQGHAVASPYGSQPHAAPTDQPTASIAPASIPTDIVQGEKQETKCRDPIFAVLLYGTVGAIVAVTVIYGPAAFEETNVNAKEYEGYVYAAIICGACALIFSGAAMWVMMQIPQFLIKTALIFTVVISLAWTILAFVSGAIGLGIFGVIMFAITLCYARAVWSRIPFATINLITASTAVKSNCGVIIIAYFFGILAYGWSILWSIGLLGVANNSYPDTSYGILFLMFVAFFFTHQVIENSVHVTVAGAVGTWWFSPEDAKHCCSSAVVNSFIRTMTTSFGSICFGSLLVAILQALKQLAYTARQNDDAGILACIAECILGCLESILRYFNKWAFIYVGLYGYSYLEAGKQVFTLFKNRGWEAIIADDLVGNTLFLLSVIVGGVTGCIGLIIEATSDFFKSEVIAGNPQVVAFVLGFVIGLVLCSILMSTIGSGVNAVIVLFAEAPADLEQNYPELSREMREEWRAAFPGCI